MSQEAFAAETGILQCLFAHGWADRVLAMMADRELTAENAFLLRQNSLVWKTASELHTAKRPLEFFVLKQALADARAMEEVDENYLLSLFGHGGAAAEAHRDSLHEKLQLRQTVELCRKTILRASSGSEQAAEIISELHSGASAIQQVRARKKVLTMAEHLKAKIERMERANPDEGLLPSGLAKLDRESRVFRTDMPLLKAQEKVGKSMAAITICGNLLVQGHACGYFTLEMPEWQQVDRLVHGVGRIPLDRNHQSRMSEGDFSALSFANAKLQKARLELRDDCRDLASIVCACREMKRRWPDLAAVFVDYAQLVECRTGRKSDNREREIATISKTFRDLCFELDAAIYVLSQVNKQDDSRESKSLEQDATAIWHLKLVEDEPHKRILAIPRQRNGDSGIGFPVTFCPNGIPRVEDYADEPA